MSSGTAEARVFSANFFDTSGLSKDDVDLSITSTSTLVKKPSLSSKSTSSTPTGPRPVTSALFSAQYAESLPAIHDGIVDVTGRYDPELQQWVLTKNNGWTWYSFDTTICSDDTEWSEQTSYSTGNENLDGDCGIRTDTGTDDIVQTDYA